MTNKDTQRAEELLALNWPAHGAPAQGLGNAKEAADTPEQESFKRAAQQLAKFLDSKGVKLSHSLAIEALTKSMGFENWRTLRARLAAPLPEPITDGQYSVSAIYQDNYQLYGDHTDGSSPLDAAIGVMIERLTDVGSATAVSIADVRDRFTGELVLCPTYINELDLEHVGEAIAKLCVLARKNLGEPPKRGIEAAETWDRAALPVEFWETLCIDGRNEKARWRNLASYQALDDMIEDYGFDTSDYGDEPTSFVDTRGGEHEVNVVEFLKELIALAEKGLDMQQLCGAKDSGVYQVLQMKNILEFHDDRLAVLFNGETVQ
jgi:hypothetical protein